MAGPHGDMSHTPFPYALWPLEAILEGMTQAARASAQRRLSAKRRKQNGTTLRPGGETPLWNRLVEEVQPLLKRRGEKAQLGRLLGVHRQAINEYFVARTRMPDAERVLLLQEWLRIRGAGKKPAW
jgi:hypothetical protein